MKPRTIDSETSIAPRAIAEAVPEEASAWLGEPLPRSWIQHLVTRSNTIYTHNQNFRRRISASGNSGRDRLWAFHRHWLSALIQQHRPHLYPKLPTSFQVGRALPIPSVKQKPKWRRPRFSIPTPFVPLFL